MSEPTAAARLVSERWNFRAMHVPWAEHLGCVRDLRARLSRPLPAPSPDADVCVVLPSYRRVDNLEVSARLALAAPSARWVVVVNDDPDRALAGSLRLEDPRLEVIDRPARVGPVGRYLAARRYEAGRYVSFDDDLFMPPAGLERLALALREEPRVPHGFYGQRRRPDGRFEDNLARFAGRVDVLNRGYAFTSEHLDRYFELVDALGIDLDDPAASIALDDDLILSFCGAGRPRVHDLGPWLDCPSERRRGLARWRRPDAERVRRALYEALLAVAPRPAARFVPPPPRPGSSRVAGLALLEAVSGVGLARGLLRRWRGDS